MAKPNYQFERRQRDLAKKQKQEEKRQRKLAAKLPGEGDAGTATETPEPQGTNPATPASGDK